jgi:hypothetical protein
MDVMVRFCTWFMEYITCLYWYDTHISTHGLMHILVMVLVYDLVLLMMMLMMSYIIWQWSGNGQ